MRAGGINRIFNDARLRSSRISNGGRKMKIARIGSLCLLLATTACLYTEPNVYAMDSLDVVSRLARVKVEPSNNGPFGRLDFSARRQGSRKVIWTATGSHAHRRCEIEVTPVEPGSSRVDINCRGASPSSGVVAGLETSYTRKRAIELIDATLRGREYDPRLAQGSTAWGWPDEQGG
jgi:hypothetical protein